MANNLLLYMLLEYVTSDTKLIFFMGTRIE